MSFSFWLEPHGRYDTPEDRDAARHERSVRAFDFEHDEDHRSIWCGCDEPSCVFTHDDCTCPADCERHGTGCCMRCQRIRPTGELIELECKERWCPACFVLDFVADPDWDVSAFLETIVEHGVWLPNTEAAPAALAAE